MGHREDLLEGAKRCLLEKGYARTTARDIVAASGANLASIGYHYGSKDALMRQAVIASTEEWGAGIAPAPGAGDEPAPDADPLGRFAAVWDQVLQRIATEPQFIAAQVEVLGLLPRDAALREAVGEVLPEGGEELVAAFEGVPDAEVDAETARVVGSFYRALLTGLMVQSLLGPDRMPTGRDLATALRRVTTGGAPGPE